MPVIFDTLNVMLSKLSGDMSAGTPWPVQPTLEPAVPRGARTLNGMVRKPCICPTTVRGLKY
jgi:hypothetical protein